jgi:hypothetical protein
MFQRTSSVLLLLFIVILGAAFSIVNTEITMAMSGHNAEMDDAEITGDIPPIDKLMISRIETATFTQG